MSLRTTRGARSSVSSTRSPRRPGAALRPRAGRQISGSTLALLILLLIGVAAPLTAVLARAVTGYRGQPSALPDLLKPHMIEILGNTVLLGVLVVVIATFMAAPLAFLMSWTRLRDHRWIDVLLMVPFMTPPYVAALAWLDFTRVNGLGEQLFGPGGAVLRSVIESPFGMALVIACESFTFLYLILRNHLDSVPASLDEVATVTGASPWQRFTRILVPLSRPTFALGALIIFIRAAGEFGTPVTLGNKIGFPVLVSEIYRNVTIDPLDFSSAAAYSCVLLTLGITVWGVQQWMSRTQVPFGGRVARRTTVSGAALSVFGWAWLAVVTLLAVIIPYIAILIGSMTILRSQPATLDNLTFDYFLIVLQPGAGLTGLQTSLVLALVAASIATLIGIASALVVARHRSGIGRLIDWLAVASDTIPTIVLAIGFIFLWNSPWLPVTPYNTQAMVVIAYTVVLLPMVVQNVKGARASIDSRLLEATAVSGATPLQAFTRVTLPLLLPGIVTGWLLAFLLGLREVVMSSLVRPASLDLLSPWIMSQFDQGNRAEALAMTVIGVFGSTVVFVIVDFWRRRQAERRLA